jgi:hypothetical protein
MRDWLNRLPIRPEQRLPLAIGCGGLMAMALLFSCCGGLGFLTLRARGTRPTHASAAKVRLSRDAMDLLAEAAAYQSGRITMMKAAGQFTLLVGERKIFKPEDGAREQARWRAALNELLVANLIEGDGTSSAGGQYDFERWRVTTVGYQLAHAIH